MPKLPKFSMGAARHNAPKALNPKKFAVLLAVHRLTKSNSHRRILELTTSAGNALEFDFTPSDNSKRC